MPEVFEFLAARGEGGAGDGFAVDYFPLEFIEWSGEEVRMRKRVIAETGAGVEPQIQDLAQFGRGHVSFINEADDGDFLVADGL